MTTTIQNPQAPIQQMNQGVEQTVSGFQNYVTTPVANTLNYPKLATTVLVSYVALEVLNHVVLGTYVLPWVVSTFTLGATATGAILYGTLAVSALGLSWLAYKFFFKKNVVKTVNTHTQYVPVITPNS